MPFVILGAGGHSLVVAECAQQAGMSVLGFIINKTETTTNYFQGLPVLGNDELIADEKFICEGVLLGIGDNRTRLKLTQQCIDAQRNLPLVAHPMSWVSPSAECEHGTVVMANASVQTQCRVGKACIINTNASIDHDCVLANGVHIAPGAHVAGGVTIGEGTHIGIGATVIEGIHIGAYCFIAAGAVVVRDVPDGQRVAGVPARPMV